MIRQIVGRCHVGQSNLQVIRYFISRIKKPSFKTWMSMSREARHRMLREAVEIHRENRRMYVAVQYGVLDLKHGRF